MAARRSLDARCCVTRTLAASLGTYRVCMYELPLYLRRILLERHSTQQHAFWRSWQPTNSSYLFRVFSAVLERILCPYRNSTLHHIFLMHVYNITSKFQRKCIPSKTQSSNYEIQNSAIILNFFPLPHSRNIHFPMTVFLPFPTSYLIPAQL
jgi:hypothetical protein